MVGDKLKQFLNYKFPLFAFFYFALLVETNLSGGVVFTNAVVLFVAYFLIGFFGYLTNDIADSEMDAIAGKQNMVHGLSFYKKLILALASATAGTLIIGCWAQKTTIFVVLEIVLLLLYSFPPFRLKERGIWGVLTDAVYAYVMPSIILLVFANSLSKVDRFYLVFIPLFSFLLGVKNILDHQIADIDLDRLSRTKTFATEFTFISSRLILPLAFASVLIWFLGWLYCFVYINALWLYLFLAVVPSSISAFKLIYGLFFTESKFRFDVPEFDALYYGMLTLIGYILIENRNDLLYICLFLLISSIFNKLKFIYWQAYKAGSFIVNHTLYYLFLSLGVDLKKRAEEKRRNIEHLKKPTISIAVIEKNVHGLWIGNALSAMELLTIKSFLANGYTFHLWTYNKLSTELPEGCVLCDANQIIPQERVFNYKYSSQFGIGKGSFSGFSDIFRYKLLYDIGGWWVDMDVTCLKPFDVDAPYFFREHHDLMLVGNIIKAPKGSVLMWRCYEEALIQITENNRDWHKPINILIRNVETLQLQNYITRGVSNSDEWHKIVGYIKQNQPIANDFYFIHWCNEVWRTNGYSKDRVLYSSTYGQLLMRYQLLPDVTAEEARKADTRLRIRYIIEKVLERI